MLHTHTAGRHAPGTRTPTHPAHVFHARAHPHSAEGERNALLHQAEDPSLPGTSVFWRVLVVCARSVPSPPAKIENRFGPKG